MGLFGFHLLTFILDKMQVLYSSWGVGGGEWWVEDYSGWNKQGVLVVETKPLGGIFHLNYLTLPQLYSHLSDLGLSVLYSVCFGVICSLFWDLKALFEHRLFCSCYCRNLKVLCYQSN